MYMSVTASTTIESALILSKSTLEAEAAVRTEASMWTYPFVFPCSQASTQMLFWTAVISIHAYWHCNVILISRHSHLAQHLLLSVLIHVCTYVCIIYICSMQSESRNCIAHSQNPGIVQILRLRWTCMYICIQCTCIKSNKHYWNELLWNVMNHWNTWAQAYNVCAQLLA